MAASRSINVVWKKLFSTRLSSNFVSAFDNGPQLVTNYHGNRTFFHTAASPNRLLHTAGSFGGREASVLTTSLCVHRQIHSTSKCLDTSKPSLADQILQAKAEEDSKKKEQEDPSEPKKPKPLTKWQKFGYIFFGVGMIGSTIVTAVLFG